ncbi:glycosyltransferase family 2 protein [Patescibacteria group bacterium]|nr:glycosyltransferase family 2 protein [Patescibacteria group bacterium]MBU4512442.1 glycosyltransferase family 2 protein [Patescibacteria group bacterium]MCG2692570.1 glycosyltransferase family 2 protein [Candidatus Parcubacteria bacterium]
MKKAAVIIVTYNAEKYIEPLFESLAKQDYPKDDFRLFLVENKSEDKTIAEIKKWVDAEINRNGSNISNKSNILNKDFLDVEIIENKKNLGFAGGYNVGMNKSLDRGFDYIVLLNQDMEVDEHWLSEMVKKVESDKSIGAVQSLMLLTKKRDKINSTGERLNYLGIGYSGNYQLLIINYQPKDNIISYASGAAVLFKSDVLKRVGLFDESFFMYHEDSDLSWRVRLAGYDIVLADKAIVYHDYKFNRNPKTFYWTEKNRLTFLLKNFEFKTLVLIFPIFAVMECGMLLHALVTGWFWQKIKSYGWVLRNLGNILKSRKEVQELRKVRDRDLKKYLVAGIEFGGLENVLLKYVANPVLKLYWWVVKRLI